MLSTLLILAMVTRTDTVPADLCATRAGASAAGTVQAFVAMPRVRGRDTLVTAAVCVVPRSAAKVASYHGELYFDSTSARVQQVVKAAGGMRAENTNIPGRVNFAGAEPAGFASGALLSVVLRIKPGTQPKVHLKMIELNAPDGSSLLKHLVVSPSSS